MDIKRIVISVCCLFSASAVLISGIISINEKQKEIKQEHINTVNNQQIEVYNRTKNQEGTGYLVKANGETLAVFDLIDPDTPLQTTDIYVDTLRNYDRDLVEEGITVFGEEALCLILEDFGS